MNTQTTTVTMYGIPNCDTIKKAKDWLDQHHIAYQFWDYKKQGVPTELLAQWLEQFGGQTIANTKGPTWRKLPDELKAQLHSNPKLLTVLSANSSAIKRPIMVWGANYGNTITVGFDAAQWQQLIRMGA